MTTINFNNNKAWMEKAANLEGECLISAGGHRVNESETSLSHDEFNTDRVALSKLVAFKRREKRWTPDKLAEKAGIDLEELLAIERAEPAHVEARTLFQIASSLSLPARPLMKLAGLVRDRDQEFVKATVRFAACSQPVEKLTREELAALEEYVKVLAEA